MLLLSYPESSVTLPHMRTAEIWGAYFCIFIFFLSKISFLECLGQFIGLSRSCKNGDVLKLLSFIGLTLKIFKALSEELSSFVPKLVP